MRTAETTEVRTGAGRWIRFVHIAIVAAAILSAVAANTPLWVKFLVIASLIFVFVMVSVRLAALHPPGRLRLFGDGLAWLSDPKADEEVMLLNQAWVTRWVCMIPCRQPGNGMRRDLMVCAGDNDPDDYRRLLTVLRSGSRPGEPEEFRHG